MIVRTIHPIRVRGLMTSLTHFCRTKRTHGRLPLQIWYTILRNPFATLLRGAIDTFGIWNIVFVGFESKFGLFSGRKGGVDCVECDFGAAAARRKRSFVGDAGENMFLHARFAVLMLAIEGDEVSAFKFFVA